MTNPQINFKQERDFGDLFNATFSFISQEFKRLATAILYFVVPFLLLSAIATTLYSIKSQELLQAVNQTGKPNPFAIFSVIGSLFGYLGFLIVMQLVAYTIFMATVYGYIKLYLQKGTDGFTINDVWRQVAKYFWQLFGATIVTMIVCGVGFAFCLIPGIYLIIALSIIGCIMIFEDKSFSEAFGRSINLINKNWWLTFAVIIIVTIICYILTLLISVPSLLMGFKSMFTNITTGQSLTKGLSIGFYIVNTVTSLISQIFYVIPIVITAFIYFSVVEKVEKPSLIDKIDQINVNE